MSDIQLELDWHQSAYKYYQSSRILSFLGYSKQSINALCTSIEKFLKILIIIRNNKSETDVKGEYMHNLKKLFEDSSLDPQKEFQIISYVCNEFQYNKIRYEFEPITNNLNLYHDKLDKEIIKLSNKIIDLMNHKHNSSISYSYYTIIRQDKKYKDYFLRRALKSFDKTRRIDYT
jgi:hypothetical protein